MNEETVVESLAREWEADVGVGEADYWSAEKRARWWLRAIAEKLEAKLNAENWGTALDEGMATVRWLREEAER